MDTNQPITTLLQAKEFYQMTDCSSYFMCRDYPERYEELQTMNIPEETKLQWRGERFDQLAEDIRRGEDWELLCHLFGRMADHAAVLKSESIYRRLLQVGEDMRETVPGGYRTLMAEYINGRFASRERSGPLYETYDRGLLDLTRSFAALAIHYCQTDEGPMDSKYRIAWTPERPGQAIARFYGILEELGLL